MVYTVCSWGSTLRDSIWHRTSQLGRGRSVKTSVAKETPRPTQTRPVDRPFVRKGVLPLPLTLEH